jgi:phosphoribosylformylglycinamidine cyclo-ligase
MGITGGGFYENIPRMLPEGVHAMVKRDSYDIPPIFGMLQKDGDIAEQIMYNTYNMGLGMVIGVDKGDADKALKLIEAAGEKAYIIGEAVSGTKGVSLC